MADTMDSKPRDISNLDFQVTRVVALGLWLASVVLTGIVLWFARGLRPIADDYSIGVFATRGPFGGAAEWLASWSGDVVAVGINILVVGLPLVHFPWPVASATPFIVTSLSVLAPLVVLMVFSRQHVARRIIFYLPVLFVAYWGYWWISAQSSFYPYSVPEALSASLWQNANASYVITIGVLTTLWLTLEFIQSSRVIRLALWGILGLVAGFTGPVVAASTVVMSLLLLTIRSRARDSWRSGITGGYATAAIAASLGAVVSYFSPGTQTRLKFLPETALSSELGWSLVTQIGSALTIWSQGVFTPGTMTIFVLVAAITYCATRLGFGQFEVKTGIQIGISLAIASLVLAVVTRAAEVFAYAGYWHILPTRVTWWWALVVLGATAGLWLARQRLSSWSSSVIEIAGIGALLASMYGLTGLANTVAARAVDWESGPAPVFPLYDRESPEVLKSWETLLEFRE